MTHVCFDADAKTYALPLTAVREVVECETIARVPHAPAALLGVTNLHGRVVTVVDPASLLDGRARRPGADDKLIVLARGAADLALCVVRVELAELEGRDVTVLAPDRLEETILALVTSA